MTVKDIYVQTKELSPNERQELVSLLLEDIAPAPPNTIRSREHLIEMLREGMKGELHPVTDETWERRHQRIRDRAKAMFGK
jgi:hypothetical protein